MRLAPALLAVAALTLAAGCGDRTEGDPAAPPAPPAETDTNPGKPPSGDENGVVFVKQRRAADADAHYIEGAVAYAELPTGVDDHVLKGTLPDAGEAGTLIRAPLPAGSYELTSYVRPGAGAGELDPPADRCKASVEVRGSEAVTATVVRDTGSPCEIEVDRTTFDDIVGEELERARTEVEERGFDLRVVERDGEALPVTLDLRFDRLNVAVEDGRVSGLRGIG